MNIVATFGGAGYDGTLSQLVPNATRYGADEVWVYDDRWLMTTELWARPEFQRLYTHQGVGNPNGARGFGWFAWKPYIMADALSRVDEGDIVLFTDADTYAIADFSVLFDECERAGGTLLFRAEGCDHARWCKRDCFLLMGMDHPKWRRRREHAVARFFAMQRGAAGVDEFLADWLHYCLEFDATTFEPSRLAPEYPEFHEHRTEQAIMTNLAHRNGHRLYREACQFGNSISIDTDLYPQLFVQDGKHGPKTLEGSRYFNVPGCNR